MNKPIHLYPNKVKDIDFLETRLKPKQRRKAVYEWIRGIKREVTKEEKQIFTTGFNMGWTARHSVKLNKIDEILLNPEIMQGLVKSLKDVREGKFIILTKGSRNLSKKKIKELRK